MHAFGCKAPAASAAAATAAVLPHGSSRVAAFLASSHVAAAAFRPAQVAAERAGAVAAADVGTGGLLASSAANPDEISLE